MEGNASEGGMVRATRARLSFPSGSKSRVSNILHKYFDARRAISMRGGLQEISPVLEARIGYCHGIGEPCFVVKGPNYSTYHIELDIKKLLLSILEHRLGSSARKPRPSTTSKTTKPPLSYTGRPEVSPQGKAFYDMTQRGDMPGGQAAVESRASHVNSADVVRAFLCSPTRGSLGQLPRYALGLLGSRKGEARAVCTLPKYHDSRHPAPSSQHLLGTGR